MKHLLPLCILLTNFCFAQTQNRHVVLFDLDRHELRPDQQALLLSWLEGFTDTLMKIEVIGHADFLGTAEHNMKLSERRAETVLRFLESQKGLRFAISLMDAKGEAHSKAENGTSEGIPSDRKVELIFHVEAEKPPVELQTEARPTGAEMELLVRAEVGQTVVLRHLNFFPGRHVLVPDGFPELERLIGTMKANPNLEIEIQGHICCKLDSVDGLDIDTRTNTLSHNRAEYIYSELVNAGIDPERMRYRGFAGSRPLYRPELTALHRDRNRRVEIKILKK